MAIRSPWTRPGGCTTTLKWCAHWDPEAACASLGDAIRDEIAKLRGTDIDHLLRKRAAKYAAMAQFAEK